MVVPFKIKKYSTSEGSTQIRERNGLLNFTHLSLTDFKVNIHISYYYYFLLTTIWIYVLIFLSIEL